ncbi:MAG: LCP family protein [Clostridia bacterium]|nr:LCP family protein [Clostridia bacterium]
MKKRVLFQYAGDDGKLQRRRLLRQRGMVFAIVGLLACALLFAAVSWLETRSRKPEPRGDLNARYEDTQITRGGVTYRQKQNLTAILFLGIDRETGDAEDSDFHSGGNADFLRLVVIDPSEKRVSQIQIDRDNVTPTAVLNLIGQRTDVRPMQIALSHSYGDGKEMSCQLTAEAVSRLLLNMSVPYYAALNLDGIAVLNDFAGGVAVPIDDDFSRVDDEMKQGTTVLLTGKQAEYFLRQRRDLPVGTNEARMARQQVYLTRWLDAVREKQEADPDFIGRLLDALAPYLVANMPRSQMVNLALRVWDYTREPLIEIPGSREIGTSGYVEFYPDEQALEQIVLDVFYQEM